jgi:adenylate cyclase
MAAIIAWLMTEGRLIAAPEKLLDALGKRMEQADSPVRRMRFGLRTLHPEHRGLGCTWARGQGVSDLMRIPHGIENSDAFVGSPLAYVYRHGRTFRRRLENLEEGRDHTLLHEVAAEGGTDYVAIPLRFANPIPVPSKSDEFTQEIGAALTFLSDQPGGFTDSDIVKLELLAAILAPVAEIVAARLIARTLLDTYVGPRTGAKVLSGQIRRGDSESIKAAIWFSDLRDFTRLTETLPMDDLLGLLNSYFEFVSAAVTARNGEILRFIGDAMLIVFPISTKTSVKTACEAALDSAVDAFDSLATLNHRRRRAREPEIRFGVGLHVGNVIYGNVGAPRRLDFTVMGPAVNRTARLESLTKTLLADTDGPPLLMSADFVRHVDQPARSLGAHPMKGVDDPPEVFTLAKTD